MFVFKKLKIHHDEKGTPAKNMFEKLRKFKNSFFDFVPMNQQTEIKHSFSQFHHHGSNIKFLKRYFGIFSANFIKN